MKIPEELLCLFTAEVDEQAGYQCIKILKQEITDGAVKPGGTYRVAVLGSEATTAAEPEAELERTHDQSNPPVTEGDLRSVEIESIGDQGDGIARVEQGYVIIVPDTKKHDRVTIEITSVAETVAFAEVVERKSYYE